jgi:hypothetical protein
MKAAILDALEARYDAQIAEADATIKIYLENLQMLQKSYKQLKILGSQEMPFKSEKQRRYLYKNEPAIAKKWTKKYGSKISKPKKRKKK